MTRDEIIHFFGALQLQQYYGFWVLRKQLDSCIIAYYKTDIFDFELWLDELRLKMMFNNQ